MCHLLLSLFKLNFHVLYMLTFTVIFLIGEHGQKCSEAFLNSCVNPLALKYAAIAQESVSGWPAPPPAASCPFDG